MAEPSGPAAAATEPSTAEDNPEPEPDADVGDETEDGADAAAAGGSAGTSDLAQIGEQLDFYFGDTNYRCVMADPRARRNPPTMWVRRGAGHVSRRSDGRVRRKSENRFWISTPPSLGPCY